MTSAATKLGRGALTDPPRIHKIKLRLPLRGARVRSNESLIVIEPGDESLVESRPGFSHREARSRGKKSLPPSYARGSDYNHDFAAQAVSSPERAGVFRWPVRLGTDYRATAMSTFWTHESRRRGLGLSLSVLALLAIPATADAARVKGRLDGFRLLRNPVWAEAKDPTNHGYSFREPVPTVRAEFRRPFPHIPKELCVALLAPTPQPAPKPILIRVGGGRTTPVTIVVAPGTRLSFQNTDPFKHRLYGVGIKTFPAADQGQGAAREWTPPTPGTYEIRDEAAPSLRMWIVAEPNVASIAYPSMKGEFSVKVEARTPIAT